MGEVESQGEIVGMKVTPFMMFKTRLEHAIELKIWLNSGTDQKCEQSK
jgi:hypothetical protein